MSRFALPRAHGTGESNEKLTERLGYDGSIQGTPVDDALEEQREALEEAQAVIELAVEALGQGRPRSAARCAAEAIKRIILALDAGTLEDRALAISRELDKPRSRPRAA